MTPSEIKADYRRLMNDVGETVLFRRYSGTGTDRPKTDRSVMARVIDYKPSEIIGSIRQGDRNLIILAEDIAEASIDIRNVISDNIVIRGKECSIIAVDDNTRRVQGVLIAYQVQVRG